MKISSVTLKNFRAYKSVQTIKFSTDDSKNVTICLAKNNAGKTTLAQSIYWCLYGGELNLKEPKNILNKEVKHLMKNGDEVETSVSIILEHQGEKYSINRSFKTRMSHTKYSTTEPQIRILNMSNPNDKVNNVDAFLPQSLARFFIFDGERMLHLGDNTLLHKKEVKKDIKNILELDALEKAIEHLNGRTGITGVIKKLEKELLKIDTGKSKDSRAKYLNLIDKKDLLETNIKQNKDELDNLTDKANHLSKEIRKYPNYDEIQRQRDRLISNIESSKENLEISEKNNISHFSKNFNNIILSGIIPRSLRFIDNSCEIKDVVPDVTSSSLDFIFKNKKCICGHVFDEGDIVFNYIQDSQKNYPPQSIGNVSLNYATKTKDIQMNAKNCYTDIMKNCKMFDRLENALYEHETELNKLSFEFDESNIDALSKLNADFEKVQMNIEDKRVEIRVDEKELQLIIPEISKLEKELDKHESNDAKVSKLEKQISIAKQVEERLSLLSKRETSKIHKELNDEVSKIYSTINRGTGKITITENYEFEISTKLGNTYIPDNSKGQGLSTVAAFAFVCGLTSMVRKNKAEENRIHSNEPYPLIIDAPFSNMDIDYIKKVAEILPEYAQQLIILVKDDNFDVAKETLYKSNRVGAEYHIQLDVDDAGIENQFSTKVSKREV